MHVLVTTDGSECSFKAARDFVKLIHGAHHDITILYVMPLLTVGRDTGYLEIEQQREGMSALNAVRSIFDDAGVHVQTELKQGIPVDAILQIARDGKYDLIVMGQHGRGGFREYLLGSVSKTIIQRSPCSVLVGK